MSIVVPGGLQVPPEAPPQKPEPASNVPAQAAPDAPDVRELPPVPEQALAAVSTADDADDDRGRQSQADRLLELVEGLELFHGPGQDGKGYAVVPAGDHQETWQINSMPFRLWLGRLYYDRHKKVAGRQAMQDAIDAINGKAIFDGPEREVAVRVAAAEGAYWLDLANRNWQAVKITPDGWSICDESPIRFVRRRSMLALPTPLSGGSLNELRELINLPDDEAWALVLAWVVQAMRPVGPYPLLSFYGEQGGAKSTTSRLLRGLIDPNEAPLRAEPSNARDLMIAACNGWVLGFDNISRLPPWLSDSLCRLSTGGGFATRELYSNDDEQIFQAMRPALLNGIEELATRSDLLDRSIVLSLPRIPEDKRRTEADLMHAYEEARARVLGALLHAVSAGMRNVPHVRLAHLPRMADFACWAVATESALGLTPGQFLAAYTANRLNADNTALEASLIGPAIISLMDERRGWCGTVGRLLAELERQIDEKARRHRDWPNSPAKFSGQLRRLAPNLRRIGINVVIGEHTNQGRMVYLERVEDGPSESSLPSAIVPDSPFEGEAPATNPANADAPSDDRDDSEGQNQVSSAPATEEIDL